MSLKNLDSRFHGNDILEHIQCFLNSLQILDSRLLGNDS
jgi:hypothetical protein